MTNKIINNLQASKRNSNEIKVSAIMNAKGSRIQRYLNKDIFVLPL